MILLIFLIKLFIEIDCKLTDIIQTRNGPVQGEILKTVINSVEYSSFKGIPYAEPPTGNLRFKPPVEKSKWSSTLQATVEGANCIQKDFVYHNFTGSEDCLYLNVYTPHVQISNIENDLKPVMVWIHGGTFKAGYGNSSLYGPDFILEEKVVLVTFNYRLGPLGFLSLNHNDATGNAGLKDQNLVLRWVKENIRNFGGNPDNVTLFGQSAGGVAVDLHALSEMSQDLFHRSISMSASPLCPWSFYTPDKAEKQAFALGSRLGVSTTNKDELLILLYRTSALELMKISEELGSADPPFKPTIESIYVAEGEEKFLTDCSYNKYLKGNYTKVPHITGFTKDETLLFTGSMNSILDLLNSTMNYIKSIPSLSPISIPFLDTIISIIADGTTSISTAIIKQLIEETSNILFIQGIDSKQKLLQENNNQPIYYYKLSYETEQSIHKLLYNINQNGVAHGDDFGYLFHMTVTNLCLDANDPTFTVRKRMVRLWTNFAKYGNPTPENEEDNLLQGINWPESGRSGIHLDIGEGLSVGQRPANTKVQFYELVNGAILPWQTGCTTNPLSAIANLFTRPITSFLKNIG